MSKRARSGKIRRQHRGHCRQYRVAQRGGMTSRLEKQKERPKGRSFLSRQVTIIRRQPHPLRWSQHRRQHRRLAQSLPAKLSVSPYFDDPQIVAQFGTTLQYIDYGQKTVEEAAADFQRQGERILRRAMR